MATKPEIVVEFDDYAIDPSTLSKTPKPLSEVIREMLDKAKEIDKKYEESKTA